MQDYHEFILYMKNITKLQYYLDRYLWFK